MSTGTMEKVWTKEEGFKKGWLKRKKVFLKPLEDHGMTLIAKDKDSIHKFMYEGASRGYCLPFDPKMGGLIDPFESREEKEFFEQMTGEKDLGVSSDPNCYWTKFKVRIKKDPILMKIGEEYDLSIPQHVLAVKILRFQDEIAKSAEEARVKNYKHWKFVLVDEDYEKSITTRKINTEAEAWMYFGSIKDSLEKMEGFLRVYIFNNKVFADVPQDPTTNFLMTEIEKIIKTDVKAFLQTANDPDYDIKLFIIRAIKLGAIEKNGVNSYCLPGEAKFNWVEFVEYVKRIKEIEDEDPSDLYKKIIARMDLTTNVRFGKVVAKSKKDKEEKEVK
jgi:hypothetical protein